MKKRTLLVGTLGVAALAAIAAASGDASPKLKAFAEAMGNAQSFSAKYTVQTIGGSATEYTVAFSKPNMARVETDSTLTIADGTNVTVYDKEANTFTKKPQTPADLMGMFSNLETSFWRPFFKPEAVTTYAGSKDTGTKNRAGKTLNVVTVTADPKGETTMKLYTGSEDNLLYQGEITSASQGQSPQTSVLQVTESSLNASADLFAFKAPNGAKEVVASFSKPGEFTNDFWGALAFAKANNKILMVDFMASWCGPCKMMDAEVFHSAKFKEVSKDFVLVKVDVDVQTDVRDKYGITAMPTVKFIRGDGSVLHEFVGYGGPDQVYGEINKAKGKK